MLEPEGDFRSRGMTVTAAGRTELGLQAGSPSLLLFKDIFASIAFYAFCYMTFKQKILPNNSMKFIFLSV